MSEPFADRINIIAKKTGESTADATKAMKAVARAMAMSGLPFERSSKASEGYAVWLAASAKEDLRKRHKAEYSKKTRSFFIPEAIVWSLLWRVLGPLVEAAIISLLEWWLMPAHNYASADGIVNSLKDFGNS